MNLRRSLSRLLGDTNAIEDAERRAGPAPADAGVPASPAHTVTREDDGTLVFSMAALQLLEDSVHVAHDGAGKYTVTADTSPTAEGHQRRETHFVIEFDLPADVAGDAAATYRDGMLEVRIPPR